MKGQFREQRNTYLAPLTSASPQLGDLGEDDVSPGGDRDRGFSCPPVPQRPTHSWGGPGAWHGKLGQAEVPPCTVTGC